MKPEDKAKLPKWAQREVTLMEREITALNEKVSAYYSGSDTAITWQPGYAMGIHGLPDHSVVRFKVGGHLISAHIDHTDGTLRIYGDHTLNIEPRATNCIWLTQQP